MYYTFLLSGEFLNFDVECLDKSETAATKANHERGRRRQQQQGEGGVGCSSSLLLYVLLYLSLYIFFVLYEIL